jgi:hypothetical protein
MLDMLAVAERVDRRRSVDRPPLPARLLIRLKLRERLDSERLGSQLGVIRVGESSTGDVVDCVCRGERRPGSRGVATSSDGGDVVVPEVKDATASLSVTCGAVCA